MAFRLAGWDYLSSVKEFYVDIKLLGSVKDFRCQSVMDRYDNDNGDGKCGLPHQSASTWFGKLNYLQTNCFNVVW